MAALEELISPDIVFRGSIGSTVNGIQEFKQYVIKIRAAVPDFHNHVEELIGEGEKVVARLTYTGTHRGELFGFPGTGKGITYQGIAIFQFREGQNHFGLCAWRHGKSETPDCSAMKTNRAEHLQSPRGPSKPTVCLFYCLSGLFGSDLGPDFGSGLLAEGPLDAPCSPT